MTISTIQNTFGASFPKQLSPSFQPIISSTALKKDAFQRAIRPSVQSAADILFTGDQTSGGKHVVYAGSFDPPTNGHIWMIEEAARLFDNVTVIMAVNPDKNYTFNDKQRLAMLKEITKDMPNVAVDTLSDQQFLVKKAKEIGAVGMIRGLRNITDFEYEWNLTNLNRKADDSIQTIALFTPKHLGEVSSSTVKGLTKLIGWRDMVEDMVPEVVFQQMKIKALSSRFDKMADAIRVNNNRTAREAFNEIIEGYNNPDRKYHNLDHLLDVLEQYDNYKIDNPDKLPKYPAVFELALWYHDMVDDRGNKNAVKESAEKARLFLNRYTTLQGAEHKNYLQELIMATEYSNQDKKKENPFDCGLLNDIDLSTLGKSPEKYQDYSKKIKAEYKGLVSKKDYKEGRVKVLEAILNKQPIFQTEYFKTRYETQARENLKSEIKSLSKK